MQVQEEQHGKRVFTVTELANAARASRRVLNVQMARLLKRGLARRYAQGRYGPATGVSLEDVLPLVDSSAYATGLYALYRHNLVTFRNPGRLRARILDRVLARYPETVAEAARRVIGDRG